MLDVTMFHDGSGEQEHKVKVNVPYYGEKREYTFKFLMASDMMKMAQAYYLAFVYDPFSIAKFHDETVKGYEVQSGLLFAKWENPKSIQP